MSFFFPQITQISADFIKLLLRKSATFAGDVFVAFSLT